MTETQLWIEKILQQLAAESYLDNFPDSSDKDIYDRLLVDRLALGANNYRIYSDDPEIRGILEDPTQGDEDKQHATRMLKKQAEDFVEDFEILHHPPNRSTGFSATLTQKKSTGEITLSFRSTEFRAEKYGGDTRRDGIFGADGDIFFDGYTLGQLMSMEQYYQWLVSESGLITADTQLDVTGYSLGGQLATVFTLLHEDVVNKAYTFNGVGLGENFVDPQLASQIIEEYRLALKEHAEQQDEILPADFEDITADIQLVPKELTDMGLYETTDLPSLYQTDSHASAESLINSQFGSDGANPFETDTTVSLPESISDKIMQIYGHADHNDMELVANQGINSSQEMKVFIEDQPDWIKDGNFLGLGGDFGDTHSIILLLDSLLLTEALQTIDPSLNRLELEKIYSASLAENVSNYSLSSDPKVNSNSLEATLDSIRKALLGENFSPTNAEDMVNAFGMTRFRNSFYNNIEDLKIQVAEMKSAGMDVRIRSLLGIGVDEIVLNAMDSENSLSWRYALQNLNPLVVETSDQVYQKHNNFELYSLYDPQTQTGNMTESYLRDRAEMLFLQTQVRLGDLQTNEVHGFDDRVYSSATDALLKVTTDAVYNPQEIIFANDEEAVLQGTQYDDRIYAGFAEIDHVLEGGEGNDYLEGGKGNDTYIYNEVDGFDTILDTDGMGSVLYNGEQLTGGSQIAESIYQSDDGLITYMLEQNADGTQSLLINNEIRILNFTDENNLNIHLTDQATHDPSRYLSSWGSSDNDVLQIKETAAYIDGGAGHDFLASGFEHDVLIGGAGDDWLDASDGNDYVDGGTGHDLLSVGSGSNTADGGEGSDIILSDRYLETLANADISWEKRIWLDLGGKWLMSASSDALLVDADGNLGLHLDIDLPEEELQGVSFDGQLNYHYFPQTKSLTYTDMNGNVVRDLELQVEMKSFENTDAQALSGGSGSDVLIGNSGADNLHGGMGDDRLQGRSGDDVMVSGSGNDWLLANEGDDYLSGGNGNDWLFGGAGRDQLYGGDGNDFLAGDNDYLAEANQKADRLFGEAGDDVLFGNAGTDELSGGEGQDVLYGGNNADRLFGDAGVDQLYGENGDDYLNGGGHDDVLYGEQGVDWLEGAGGNDRLYGGDHSDTLIGGAGNDILSGQQGNDTYLFHFGDGLDQIQDASSGNILKFGHGIDRSRIKTSVENIDGREDLVIDYGFGDQIRIKDFEGRFNSVEYADQPGVQYAFSTLLKPWAPPVFPIQPVSDYSYSADEKFNEEIASSLNEQVSENYDSPQQVAMLNRARNDYSNRSRQFIVDGLQQNGFAMIGDNLYEQQPTDSDNDRYYTQASTDTDIVSMEGCYFRRSSRDMDTTRLESWQTSVQATELQPYEVPVDLSLASSESDDLSVGSGYDTGTVLPVDNLTRTEYRPVTTIRTVTWYRDLKTVNQMVILGSENADTIDLGDSHFNIVQSGGGDDLVKGDIAGDQYSIFQGGYAELPYGEIHTFSMPGNYIDGGKGNDHLEGSAYEDVLTGGMGNDTLLGGGGNDTYLMTASNGHDLVYDNGWTTSGENTEDKVILPEDVLLEDLSFQWSEILFEAPFTWQTPQALLPELHSMLTMQWSVDNSVSIILPHSSFNAASGIDYIELADGARYSIEDVIWLAGSEVDFDPQKQSNSLSAGFSYSGGAGDDDLTIRDFYLTHTPVSQLGRVTTEKRYSPDYYPFLVGGAGSDYLQGDDSMDFLIGGELHHAKGERFYSYWGDIDDIGNVFNGAGGDDVIWATAGNDVFEYSPGDGHDVITDELHGHDFPFDSGYLPQITDDDLAAYQLGQDSLRFQENINPEDISVSQQGGHMVFHVQDDAGSIKFYNWYASDHNQLKSVEFASGKTWGEYEIERLSKGLPLNSAPEVNVQIHNQQFDNNQPINFQFDENAFVDADNDELQYSLTLKSGEAIPQWLSFDTQTMTLSSVGYELPAGEYGFRLTATDIHAESAAQEFTMMLEEKYNPLKIEGKLWYGFGSDSADRITGDTGDNWLFARDGNDLLRGGEGNDRLYGGRNDDVYLYSKGDGQDKIFDNFGNDILVLEDIDVEDVSFRRSARHLDIEFAHTDDSIHIFQMFNPWDAAIDRVEFDDGTAFSNQQLDALISAMAAFNTPVSASSLIAANETMESEQSILVANVL